MTDSIETDEGSAQPWSPQPAQAEATTQRLYAPDFGPCPAVSRGDSEAAWSHGCLTGYRAALATQQAVLAVPTAETQRAIDWLDGFVELMGCAVEPAITHIATLRAALATQQAVQAEPADDERWWSPPDSFGVNWLTNGAALHPLTANLVVRFARALAAKLAAAEVKYGYSDGWRSADWMDECRAKLAEHVAKGDPRDVAAYCAFLWHHGESTTTPPAPGQVERGRWLCLTCKSDTPGRHGLMDDRVTPCPNGARSSEGGAA